MSASTGPASPRAHSDGADDVHAGARPPLETHLDPLASASVTSTNGTLTAKIARQDIASTS